MDDREREEIKLAFNDPDNVVRILVATDAASEGLNLQETARLIAHYDIPWNPSRLDQRNGRLDRHGQANDVVVFHFTSEDNADLKFLGHVIQKVNTIREELGSMGDVFDAAFQRRFADLEDTDRAIADLDMAVESQRGRIALPITAKQSGEELAALAQLRAELDFSPETLRDTLEIALGINGAGLPRLEPTDDLGRSRLKYPIPSQWENLVNDSLRLESSHGSLGALPAIVFDQIILCNIAAIALCFGRQRTLPYYISDIRYITMRSSNLPDRAFLIRLMRAKPQVVGYYVLEICRSLMVKVLMHFYYSQSKKWRSMSYAKLFIIGCGQFGFP